MNLQVYQAIVSYSFLNVSYFTVTLACNECTHFGQNDCLGQYIYLGRGLSSSNCRTQCPIQMQKKGWIKGCWTITSAGNCYCRNRDLGTSSITECSWTESLFNSRGGKCSMVPLHNGT